MALNRAQKLREEIARTQTQLVELGHKLNANQQRLAELKQELAAIVSVPMVLAEPKKIPPRSEKITTAKEKISLFRELFRGREDVYPKLWISSRSGKRGYSPVCSNEWLRGICEKPRMKCSDCSNQAYVPVTDKSVLDHLRGRHTIGVYPLLKDETCWFLTADFDKECWAEDVLAFMETSRSLGIPAAVERSRSGNGAHIWFFFSEPVPAVSARRLGCYLITETMSRRHQLTMSSYDRLFPNQDTLPRGGFGNLIALPLQFEPRRAGNSLFVDETFVPYPDQWDFLASIPRIALSTVESITHDATRQGKIIGVRFAYKSDVEENDTPWENPSLGRLEKTLVNEPIPSEVHAVLTQRLFVEKKGLQSALVNQIKRLAAFQNPEFYKRQSMRLSTNLTPRVISCAEEFSQHIALPRGCSEELSDLLKHYGSKLFVDDQRYPGEEIDVRFNGKLTNVQQQAVDTLCNHDIGVLVAPPGAGKTVVGIWLIAARQRNTLVLVHRQPLLDQWIAQLALFFGLHPKDIGQIRGGKHNPNRQLDIAMIQSLVRQGDVNDLVSEYGHVIVDECHHLPAISFERVLAEVKARFITGLTATPQRRDGHHPIIEMQMGPVRFSVNTRNQAAQRPFIHKLIVRDIDSSFDDGGNLRIQDLYRQLVADNQRNDLIFNDVLNALGSGRSPILLTQRKQHLEYFADRFSGIAGNLIVLHGGKGSKRRREDLNRLARIPDTEERLILATGHYVGEGFDDSRLDTLFLAMPISWKGTLIQYAGRLHRLHPQKTEVQIYDYVDRNVPILAKMFERRLRGYRAMGYDSREDITKL